MSMRTDKRAAAEAAMVDKGAVMVDKGAVTVDKEAVVVDTGVVTVDVGAAEAVGVAEAVEKSK